MARTPRRTFAPRAPVFSLWAFWRTLPPRGVPAELWALAGPLRTRARVYAAVQFGLIAFLLGGLLIAPGWIVNVPLWLKVSVGGTTVVLSLALVRMATAWQRRASEIVASREYRYCLFCGYSLTGLPGEGRCPECGAGYRVASIRDEWRKWAGLPSWSERVVGEQWD